jgi:arsenate reductase
MPGLTDPGPFNAATHEPFNVLVLCTGNSARSILAEALFNAKGRNTDAGRPVMAFSAGSQPKGEPHPAALKLLHSKGFTTDFARSKSWEEFAAADAPQMDMIVTVCDSAASEACPVWPGHPLTIHWGIPDPAAATGTEAEIDTAFEVAYARLEARVMAFLALPFDTMPPDELKRRAAEIGNLEVAEALTGLCS